MPFLSVHDVFQNRFPLAGTDEFFSNFHDMSRLSAVHCFFVIIYDIQNL